MTEENKTIARKVYEIISTGDFDWAEEIIDASAPKLNSFQASRSPSS